MSKNTDKSKQSLNVDGSKNQVQSARDIYGDNISIINNFGDLNPFDYFFDLKSKCDSLESELEECQKLRKHISQDINIIDENLNSFFEENYPEKSIIENPKKAGLYIAEFLDYTYEVVESTNDLDEITKDF